MTDLPRKPQLLPFLPAPFQPQNQEDLAANNPLEILLLAFESQMLRSTDSEWPLERILEEFSQYFDPGHTPAAFVPWLAQWFALDLKSGLKWQGRFDLQGLAENDWQRLPLAEERNSINREILRRLPPMLPLRGTGAYLRLVLEVYYQDDFQTIEINEMLKPFQLRHRLQPGESGKPPHVLGKDSTVGEARPYFFQVSMTIRGFRLLSDERGEHKMVHISTAPHFIRERKLNIQNTIDAEKPAHTNYRLQIAIPAMQVKYAACIGFNTMIGHITM